jgi:hypothetical protein
MSHVALSLGLEDIEEHGRELGQCQGAIWELMLWDTVNVPHVYIVEYFKIDRFQI